MSTRLEREREFHDRGYMDNVRQPTRRFYAVTGAISRWHKDSLSAAAHPGALALEYGCGRGSRAFHLARAGASVVGIDISPVAIEQATEEGRAEGLEERLEFRVMDAEHLDYPDDHFDIVTGSGVLHHLDLERGYGEVARVLKPTGVGLFEEPMGHNPAINAYRNRTPQMRTVDEHPLLMRDLEMAKRYFDDVGTEFFTLTTLAAFPLRNVRGFERIVDGLDSIDRGIFRAAPALRRYAWMVGLTLRKPRPGAASS